MAPQNSTIFSHMLPNGSQIKQIYPKMIPWDSNRQKVQTQQKQVPIWAAVWVHTFLAGPSCFWEMVVAVRHCRGRPPNCMIGVASAAPARTKVPKLPRPTMWLKLGRKRNWRAKSRAPVHVRSRSASGRERRVFEGRWLSPEREHFRSTRTPEGPEASEATTKALKRYIEGETLNYVEWMWICIYILYIYMCILFFLVFVLRHTLVTKSNAAQPPWLHCDRMGQSVPSQGQKRSPPQNRLKEKNTAFTASRLMVQQQKTSLHIYHYIYIMIYNYIHTYMYFVIHFIHRLNSLDQLSMSTYMPIWTLRKPATGIRGWGTR